MQELLAVAYGWSPEVLDSLDAQELTRWTKAGNRAMKLKGYTK
jgi:hypothetical protein